MIRFESFGFRHLSQAEPALHDINLTIYKGERVLIVGPNGSGESTIGSYSNGLTPFTYKGEVTGSLKIKDKETGDMNIFGLSKLVGTMLQDASGQFTGLTVGEDIAFALGDDCVDLVPTRESVQRVADLVDMGQLLESSPFELSGGRKQGVSFAGVLVDDVDTLLFDEPLANLDSATGKTIIGLIDRVWKTLNKTVVIIEHRLEDVLYRGVDRIVVISDGRIATNMTPGELIAADILPKLGIREPLYATALKYAEVYVTPEIHPGRVETLDIDSVKGRIKTWNLGLKVTRKATDRPKTLEMDHVSLQYTKKRKILKDISFAIEEEEMVSIVGTNGAGKSTLAKLICGFITEDEDGILFGGEDLGGKTIKEYSDKIGFVMQDPNQMVCKPIIYDGMVLGLRIRGMEEPEVERRVDKTLQICGLSPFKKWPISALSYGQKKRVTVVSVLTLEPKVLVLDEPTAGQDYHHYTGIMKLLKNLNNRGVTILMITRGMHLMLEYAPHAIVVSDGQKLGDSTAADILTNEEIAEETNLRITSLYELAVKCEIEDPARSMQSFIDYERELR